MLPWFLMDSPAWLSLKPTERACYLCLARRYNGKNNGSLALSAREVAANCNINKDTATGAFRTLQERGFVDLVTPGGFSLKLRHAAEWRLTSFPCDKTGTAATKAYMKWRNAEPGPA